MTALFPFIDLFCGTAKANAVWDTGAVITIVDKAFLEAHEDIGNEPYRQDEKKSLTAVPGAIISPRKKINKYIIFVIIFQFGLHKSFLAA